MYFSVRRSCYSNGTMAHTSHVVFSLTTNHGSWQATQPAIANEPSLHVYQTTLATPCIHNPVQGQQAMLSLLLPAVALRLHLHVSSCLRKRLFSRRSCCSLAAAASLHFLRRAGANTGLRSHSASSCSDTVPCRHTCKYQQHCRTA
jgi:hypothetical protein